MKSYDNNPVEHINYKGRMRAFEFILMDSWRHDRMYVLVKRVSESSQIRTLYYQPTPSSLQRVTRLLERRRLPTCKWELDDAYDFDVYDTSCGQSYVLYEMQATELNYCHYCGRRIEVIDKRQKCRVCGCTQYDPCEAGCWWVEDDLCSQCVKRTDTAGRDMTDLPGLWSEEDTITIGPDVC